MESPGPYSKGKMRRLAVIGILSGVIFLGMALLELAEGDPDAPMLVWLACALLAFLGISMIFARRRGRM